MSINSHVRSYIHQHNLNFIKPSVDGSDTHRIPQKRGHSQDSVIGQTQFQSSWGMENKKSETTGLNQISDFSKSTYSEKPNHLGKIQPPKNLSMATRFPFNQCSDFSLRETKKSLDTSLRQFVQNKSAIAFMGSLRSCLRESNYTNNVGESINSQNTSIKEYVPNTQQSEYDSLPEDEVSSILIRPTIESEPRQMLLNNLNECFQKYLTGNIAIKENDDLFHDTINYITNLFIQEFSAAETHELCLEILNTKDSGELEPILLKLIEETQEKHIEQGFDDFQDLISEFVISGEYGKSQSLDNPQFYRAFEKIWRLNPEEFIHYDLDTLFSFCSNGKERPFTNITLFHKLLNDMEGAAMKMNLVKFHFAFRRDVPIKMRHIPSRDLSLLENSLRDAVKMSMHLIKEKDRGQKPRSYKKERVRFHEGHVEVYV